MTGILGYSQFLRAGEIRGKSINVPLVYSGLLSPSPDLDFFFARDAGLTEAPIYVSLSYAFV